MQDAGSVGHAEATGTFTYCMSFTYDFLNYTLNPAFISFHEQLDIGEVGPSFGMTAEILSRAHAKMENAWFP